MLISFILIVPILLYIGINLFVVLSCEKEVEELSSFSGGEYDAILVLGAGVRSDGTPSNMLEDRLLTAFSLWEQNAAPAIIVSGDHGRVEYDEVNVMKEYLIEKGIPSDRIFMDHAGFSTYDSMVRAKKIFGAQRLLVVTQRYHSYRALTIGKLWGISCRAVSAPILSSDSTVYPKQAWYSFRESAARVKDLFACILRREPAYLGESISLSGSGDVTNDR
jgi:vancomycin permeability regulator SanA